MTLRERTRPTRTSGTRTPATRALAARGLATRGLPTLGLAAVLATTALAAGCGDDASTSSPPVSNELVGLFRFDAGSVDASGNPTGTYFRMAIVGGNAENGPFLVNFNSPAAGGEVTILEPGGAGGLRTGGYQAEAIPAFDNGASLSGDVIKPTLFFNVLFGTSTNAVDPQTGAAVAAPTVTNDNGVLTADMSAWAASWNDQEFNQGAPKPIPAADPAAGGAENVARAWDFVSGTWLDQQPAASTEGPHATGTYDEATRRYTLDWSSHIEGGPFNDFTGVWHLEGTFEPGQVPAPTN